MEGLSGTAGRSQTGNLDPSEPRHSLDDQYIKQKTKKVQFVRIKNSNKRQGEVQGIKRQFNQGKYTRANISCQCLVFFPTSKL